MAPGRNEFQHLERGAVAPNCALRSTSSRASRRTAAFAEFNVPVLKDLTVNLAGRADKYSDFGSAFSPKASVRYQAGPWLLLRGTVSRGFRAPSLPEITNSTSVSYGSVIDKLDPITPSQSRGVTNITVANTELSPERSRNVNLGFVVSPSANSRLGWTSSYPHRWRDRHRKHRHHPGQRKHAS